MSKAASRRIDQEDLALMREIENGLPLVPEPYREIANALGLSEDSVLLRLQSLIDRGIIKRLGVIVRHRSLGYRANAMVVFDIEDRIVEEVASMIMQHPFVTLCYERPRQHPSWPYNLFLMIHGKERSVVEDQIRDIKASLGLLEVPSATLFSVRCFKQRGARYFPETARQPSYE